MGCGYAFGLRGTLRAGTVAPHGLLARSTRTARYAAAISRSAFSLGGNDTAGLVAMTPGDAHGIDAISLYGVSTRRFTSGRRSVRLVLDDQFGESAGQLVDIAER